MPRVHPSATLCPILMLHLPQDLQYDSINCLSTIPLRVVWSRSLVLNATLLQQTPHILVHKWGSIVTN